MDAHYFLSQIRTLQEHIEQKMAEIRELHTLMDAVKSMNYDGGGFANKGYVEGASFEALVAKNITLESQLNKEVERFIQIKHDIISMIQNTDDIKYSQLLFKRYVLFKPLELVAFEMGYSYGYIRQLQMHALASFYLKHKWEIIKHMQRGKNHNKN